MRHKYRQLRIGHVTFHNNIVIYCRRENLHLTSWTVNFECCLSVKMSEQLDREHCQINADNFTDRGMFNLVMKSVIYLSVMKYVLFLEIINVCNFGPSLGLTLMFIF